jgi:LPS export ABC transporter protein LptC
MMKIIERLAIILSVAVAVSFWGCGNKNEIKAPPAGVDSLAVAKIRPDQEMRNARIYLYNKAIITTDIKADYIEKYEKLDSTLAWKLNVHFFDSTGKELSNMVADSGLVRERTNIMIANGHVVVISEDNSKLETEQLLWNAQKNKIETDKFVRIIQNEDTLTGYGLEADQRLKKIKIKKQVSGNIRKTEDMEL